MNAIRTGDIPIVATTLLQMRMMNNNKQESFILNRNILLFPAENGDLPMLKYLLSCGAKPTRRIINAASRKLIEPDICQKTKNKYVEIILTLMEYVVPSSYSLDLAIGSECVDLVREMIKRGSCPSVKSLDIAIRTNNVELVKFLLPFSPRYPTQDAITFAMENNWIDMLHLLVSQKVYHGERGRIISGPFCEGYIFLAVKENKYKILEQFVNWNLPFDSPTILNLLKWKYKYDKDCVKNVVKVIFPKHVIPVSILFEDMIKEGNISDVKYIAEECNFSNYVPLSEDFLRSAIIFPENSEEIVRYLLPHYANFEFSEIIIDYLTRDMNVNIIDMVFSHDKKLIEKINMNNTKHVNVLNILTRDEI